MPYATEYAKLNTQCNMYSGNGKMAKRNRNIYLKAGHRRSTHLEMHAKTEHGGKQLVMTNAPRCVMYNRLPVVRSNINVQFFQASPSCCI